jgi:hypothetical protein
MFGKMSKRQKEQSRLEHKKVKAEKAAERKREKEQRKERVPGGEDPDLAGIVPGPQPPLEY